ncbi:uncharacterized protein LOC114344298 [Diabrotica virgifera virgifera]|uniref:Telomerase reverse transcriptase n=2 Tax=Diabrotica virgifera virgifera TaxID=50390 RepID=A0ABM5KGQ1_DIAVI|nr:uncharacterized protein LOC114344298 [Diabrotica virgifera virgifera]
MKDSYYPLAIYKPPRSQWKYDKLSKFIKTKVNAKLYVFIILRIITERYRKMLAKSCDAEKSIIELLDWIIPQNYFGSTQNRKRFYSIVNKLTSQSRGECVFKSSLIEGYDLGCIDWLQEFSKEKKIQMSRLLEYNIYLLDNIVKPLIRHFYVCIRLLKTYEIKFIPRQEWNKFQVGVFGILRTERYLVGGDFQNSRGRLMLFPKGDTASLNYRPIMYANAITKETKKKFRLLSRKIRDLAKSFSTASSCNVFSFWESTADTYHNKYLYGIKMDLEDAYGNVDTQLLCQTIGASNFPDSEKKFLIHHMENQNVTYSKKIFQWTHGLLQGDHLSAALCSLYLSILEQKHLQSFMTSDFRLHRIADDYLFCSPIRETAELFEFTFKQYFPVNESKIQRALEEDSCEIVHFGQVLNFETKEMRKCFSQNKCLTHQFKFWSLKTFKNRKQIIEASVNFRLTNHYFKHFKLQIKYDLQNSLIEYFKGMVYVAYKFDVAVTVVSKFKKSSNEMPYLVGIIKNTITVHARKVCRYSNNKRVTFQLLRMIAIKAFLIVLKKNKRFYTSTIDGLTKKRVIYLHLPDECKKIAPIFNKLPEEFRGIKMKRVPKI